MHRIRGKFTIYSNVISKHEPTHATSPRRDLLKKLSAAISVSLIALVAFAGSAQAATTTTVGADLSAPVLGGGGCGSEGCATAIVVASSPATVTVAPFDGTVTTWRIEGATNVPGYGVEVLRKNVGGTYTVTATSAAVTPAGTGIETFQTELPIKAGEYVGDRLPEDGSVDLLEGSSTEAFFEPALGIGETGPPEGEFSQDIVVAWNADITKTEPPAPAPVVTPPAPVIPPPAPTCKVPKLKGKKLKAAKKAIRAADCKVGHVGIEADVTAKTGKVIKQKPKPGTVRPAGSKVVVKLG